MVVKVKDLKPNPYRNIKSYPIDRVKVESLKTSIKNTDFWDNILARDNNGSIEIAYGHHRLQAIKELGIEEVDIPVKNIDDANMIRIMANENMSDWSASADILLETVQVAKDYLEGICKNCNYENLEEFFRLSRITKTEYEYIKKDGAGRNVIQAFLGSNWSDHYIQNALEVIKAKNTDVIREANVTGISDAAEISKALTKGNIKQSDKKEVVKKAVAKLQSDAYKNVEVKSDGKLRRTKINAAVEEAAAELNYQTTKENFNKIFPKKNSNEKPDLNKSAEGIYNRLMDVNIAISEVLENWDYINPETRSGIILETKYLLEQLQNHKGAEQWKQLK